MPSGVLVGRGYVSIRPEFEGDWTRQANVRADRAGRSSGSGFARAFGGALRKGISPALKTLGALAGVAVAGNLQGATAAAAVAAPALATVGTAAGALKLGLSGVGDAFKAAFADSSKDTAAAASATRQVESAQRSLASAQRNLAAARVQAAQRIQDAQGRVLDAERSLVDAQRQASSVQGELNGARREAARALQDMNTRLAESRLDERGAVLTLKQAEEDLKAAQQQPGTDPQELARLQLAYDRAALNLKEQRRETKRLAADTKAANKAGVEGSDKVLSVKARIADANRTVADRERALADAQKGVARARADGQRQVAAAEATVADAAAAVADAQAAAAAQTSKLDQAMAKLSPNAQSFVNAVRGLQPAWKSMRLGVQDALFAGLDDRISALGRATIPTLRRGLTGAATELNAMAKSAMNAVAQLQRTGMLDKILAGATKNLSVLSGIPGLMVAGFGQLAVAAQPAFNGLLHQFAEFSARMAGKMTAAFTSGGLQQAIGTAFDLLSQLGSILGDAFATVGNIMKAASDAGGQVLGVLGSVFAELRRITAMPGVQAALRAVFEAVAQIAAAIGPVIGAVVKAVAPLLRAIAPVIGQLAQAFGPVLTQLATQLGAALMPIVQGLLPVVKILGVALVRIVTAVMPLLQPIGALIGAIVSALVPVLQPIISVILRLVKVLVGPLQTIITALIPWVGTLGTILQKVFTALAPALTPLITVIGKLASVFANLFATVLTQLMSALLPLAPTLVGVVKVVAKLASNVLSALLPALKPLLPVLVDVVKAVATLAVSVIGALLPALKPLIPTIVKLVTMVAQLAGKALALLLPALLPLVPVVLDIVKVMFRLASQVLVALMPSLSQLITAALQLLVAVLPILPVITKLIALVLKFAVKILSVVLPPLIRLAGFLIGVLVKVLATVITWVAELVTWLRTHLGPAFRWLNAKVIQPVWNAIKKAIGIAWNVFIKPIFTSLKWFISNVLGPAFSWLWHKIIKPVWDGIKHHISTVWNKGIKPAFDALKHAIGKVGDAFASAKKAISRAWDGIKAATKKPINFVIDTVWNHGVLSVWRKIAGWVGLDKDKLKKLPLLAAGGAVPASPGIFNQPTAIVGEGNPRHPEYVIPTDPKYRGRALALWQAAGGQLMADGGILGTIGGAIKSAASFLTHPGKALGKLLAPILDRLKGLGGGAFGKAVARLPHMAVDGLKSLIGKLVPAGGGDVGGSGVRRWSGVVLRALRMLGQPAALLNTVLRRMNQESGGNPRAANLWDINARQGHPSVGLMQVIGPTFRAHAGRFRNTGPFMYGTSINPLANIYASMRYALSRYGSLSKAYNRPGGYDSGGYLQPGWNLAYNGTGRPEPVFTTQQANALMRMASAAPAGGSEQPTVSYTIHARTADFTVRDLELVQRRQEARARVGRPR